MSGSEQRLADFSVAQLADAYAGNLIAAAETEHVGRHNRLVDQCSKIAEELRSRGQAGAVFERLARHPRKKVRSWAASDPEWLDRPPAEPAPTPQTLLRREVLWQCDNSPPPALARNEIATRLQASVPEVCDRLMDLALPAIGLWPQRRAEIGATASRFGGAPIAPADW